MGQRDCFESCRDDKTPTLEFAMSEALKAINAVHKAFGAPGDYGYEYKRGQALQWLYAATHPLNATLSAIRVGQKGLL